MISFIILDSIIRPAQTMEENYLNLLYWIMSGGALSFTTALIILYKDKSATEKKFQEMQVQTLDSINEMKSAVKDLASAITSLKDSLHPRV